MAVYPELAMIGYGTEVAYEEIMRVYPNLGYRRYKRDPAAHEMRRLVYKDISQARFDAIKAFFKARKAATGSDHEFTIYDADVATSVDLTGASSTGRHTAIFTDSQLSFTRSGKCRYSGEVNVLFLT